jgi:hypothetical protein
VFSFSLRLLHPSWKILRHPLGLKARCTPQPIWTLWRKKYFLPFEGLGFDSWVIQPGSSGSCSEATESIVHILPSKSTLIIYCHSSLGLEEDSSSQGFRLKSYMHFCCLPYMPSVRLSHPPCFYRRNDTWWKLQIMKPLSRRIIQLRVASWGARWPNRPVCLQQEAM